jgi:hypothetical protein
LAGGRLLAQYFVSWNPAQLAQMFHRVFARVGFVFRAVDFDMHRVLVLFLLFRVVTHFDLR